MTNMKISLRVIQILDLDANSIELTCNTVVNKKAGFGLQRIIGGDMQHLREEMVESMPKMFKIVVSPEFYSENSINLGSMVDIEVSV